MEIDLPIRGLEPLTPLFAYLMIYFVILVVLRLFLWPLLLSFGRRGTLRKIIRFLLPVIFRTLLFGGLILGFIWALLELGIGEEFYDSLRDAAPGVPTSWIAIALVGLFLVGAFVVLRRSIGGQASKK